MEKDLTCSDSEACLQFINSKFDYYKKVVDDDQQACTNMIDFIRQQLHLYNNEYVDDDKFRSITGFDRIELADQLNYFEHEAAKTNEENKACLLKMFQNLFNLHNRCAFKEVLINERHIAKSFQYRPSVLSNIQKLRCSIDSIQSTPSSIISEKNNLTFIAKTTPHTLLKVPTHAISFSNRAGIQAFQEKQINSIPPKIIPKIDSNEIDLTSLVRETNSNKTSNSFKFSKISRNWQQQQQQNSTMASSQKTNQQSQPCDDALLSSTNERYVLIYNMNVPNTLYLYDTQRTETKEIRWDEGEILSLGHIDSNVFYIITSTKIFLYDIIKENVTSQYFLYDTLYKDLLLVTNDSYYKTVLKRNNQIQSMFFEDYCYYLYTNKEYNQMLVKCLVETFFHEASTSLSKLYPDVQCFISFTITAKSLITFLIHESNTYQLLVCDENKNFAMLKKILIPNLMDPTKIVTAYSSTIKVYTATKKKSKAVKYGAQLWFILDVERNCVGCRTHETHLGQIEPLRNHRIQSITIYENKLILTYNELSVEIIDIDNYCSSFEI